MPQKQKKYKKRLDVRFLIKCSTKDFIEETMNEMAPTPPPCRSSGATGEQLQGLASPSLPSAGSHAPSSGAEVKSARRTRGEKRWFGAYGDQRDSDVEIGG